MKFYLKKIILNFTLKNFNKNTNSNIQKFSHNTINI